MENDPNAERQPCSCDGDSDAAWITLLASTLGARPEITVAIELAVIEVLRGRRATPEEACLGLAHAAAGYAAETSDPRALMVGVFHMARLILGAQRTAER